MKFLNLSVLYAVTCRYRLMILILLAGFGWTGAKAQSGTAMYNAIPVPVNSCAYSNFIDYQANAYFNDSYGQPNPEVWYTFTLSAGTYVGISLCGSDFDTYLSVMDPYQNVIASNDDDWYACSGITSYIYQYFPAGTYFIAAEGSGYNTGNLALSVDVYGSGTPSAGANMSYAINAGTFSSSGSYSNTLSNADECLGNDIGQQSNDIYYKLVLTGTAQVTLTQCGSSIDSYMHLLDASGNILMSDDDNSEGPCSGTTAYIQTTLSAGTYYVVSEGYSRYTGNITTNIGVSMTGSVPVIAYTAPSSLGIGSSVNLTPTNTGGAVSSGGQTTITYATGFYNPLNTAIDASGNVYVADAGNHQIKKITPGGTVSVLAGIGYSGYADGTGTSAIFRHPSALAVDASGNIFVSDQQNHRIRKITPAGVVTTFAGSGSAGFANGTGTGASFQYPMGLAFDASGNLYVADAYNHRIRKITPAGLVTTFAGTGSIGTTNSTSLSSTFNYPMGLTFDASGNLYVADRTNHMVRKISTSGNVTTLAGNGTSGFAEGTGTAARFNNANYVAVDASGTVYLVDHLNNRIRKITPAGVVTTLAGTGTASTVNGSGSVVTFNSPYGICIDPSGDNLYVAENNANVVRKIALIKGYTISPALPAGLVFNGETGAITGTPTASSPSTTYTITAYNSSGTGTTTITFAVITLVDYDKNWVHTKSYDNDGNLVSESKSFYDKAGRNLQDQVKNISEGQILASQTVYDAEGRAAIQTLTAPINSLEFIYKPDFITTGAGYPYTYENFDLTKTNSPDAVGNYSIGTLGWYYSNNNTAEQYVPTTNYPYSRTDFYKDGTGAVKRSAGPGDQVRMGSGHESRSFVTPIANELDHYIQVRNKFFSSEIIGNQPITLRGQAIQKVGHDPNNNEVVEICDKSGNVLMKARPGNDLTVLNNTDFEGFCFFKLFAPTAVNIGWGTQYKLYDIGGDEQEVSFSSGSLLPAGYYKFTSSGIPLDYLGFNYNVGYSDISYSFYNESGQLIASIAPNGVKKLLENGLNSYSDLNSIPFVNVYEYDLQGRLIATIQTDKGRTEYIYRQDGNIRFSQNSAQRSANPETFSYTTYDRWGRGIESGEYSQGSITFASAKSNANLLENTESDGGLSGGTKLVQAKIHFDLENNSHGVSGYIQDEGFLKGAITYTENDNAKTWYNYDGEGRISWVVKQIIGLGYKTIDYTYDAKGNVVKVDFQKNNTAERFTHEYEYDLDGRLKIVYTSTTSSGKKEQARYHYYIHGPLKRVEIAGNLQGIDYTYTSQGALKSINHPLVSSDPGGDGTQNSFSPDVFGMTLEYFNGDYLRTNTGIASLATGGVASYNGNIMGQSWRSQKPQSVVNIYGSSVNDPVMTTYSYDNKYQFDNNKFGTPNFSLNSFTEAVNSNREHGLNYDANGNITSLNRTNSAGTNIANYSYNYVSNSNRLASVNNYASYSYDELGQMKGQVRDNGQGYYINYDVTGKIIGIYSDVAKTNLRVSFAYDENGSKIRKTDHIQNITTYYVIDASGNLLAIYDDKGTALQQKELPIYAASRLGIYSRLGNSYQYELTDHLGNVRAVINENKLGNGQADVISYSDYYPYGSPLTFAASDYRFGYQGQYAEVDKETGWNNFDLRMYDPAIGRWMSTDPYGQFNSPYVGMGNNPISSTDPDGGYSWAGAFWRHVASFAKGERPGKIYRPEGGTWGFNTGTGDGVVGHFKDVGPSKIEHQVDRYLSMHADWRMGKYNSFTGKTNTYSGRIETNTFFEEMFIGGAIGKGLGGLYKGSKALTSGSSTFGSDIATLRNASRMIPEEGVHQVLIHGTPEGFYIDGAFTTSKELARSLLQSGFEKGTPIRLISCHTGVYADGAAYQLSRYLKSSVTAPTNMVTILDGGAYEIYGGGFFRTFFNTTIK